MRMTQNIHEIIADNVKRLMEHSGNLTQKDFEKAGISQKTMSNVINPGSVNSLTTSTIEKLAKFFNLEAYHLMIPNLPVEELISKRIEKIIDNYAHIPLEGRENIERIAENEVRYSVLERDSKKIANN